MFYVYVGEKNARHMRYRNFGEIKSTMAINTAINSVKLIMTQKYIYIINFERC